MFLHHISSIGELGKRNVYIHVWWLMLIYIGNKSNMVYSTKESTTQFAQCAYNRRSEGRM